MFLTYIFGYLSFFLMGLILGLIGGGGSILTVPILVYLMGVSAAYATSYSLLIVGLTAVFGSISFYRKGLVNIRSATIFAVPSVMSTYITRAFVMPKIPEIFLEQPVIITKDFTIMIFFAVLMLFSAVAMLKNSKKSVFLKSNNSKVLLLIIEGLIVGFVTGILGAGGGFLIVPALVVFLKMPIKEAIGNSLFVISLKSLAGFLGDINAGIELDIAMLAFIFLFALSGVVTSSLFVDKVNGQRLQILFACFIVCISIGIFVKEFLFLF